MTTGLAFTTPAAAPRWRRWLVLSPVARIAWFVVAYAVLTIVGQRLIALAGWNKAAAPSLDHALATLFFQLVPAVIAYLLVVRLIEKRRVAELAVRDILRFGGSGLVLGAGLFTFVIGVLALAGAYHVTGVDTHVDWLPGVLVAGIGAGIGEEILIRGVLFRVVEEGLGTWWALAISAAVFGLAHMLNPNATAWSTFAIMLEAGVLLALVYHVTRTLWASIGLHAAWNVSEGTLYGVPVSGTEPHGFLVSNLVGPQWLTGGGFGAEASVVAVATCLAAALVLLGFALRSDSIVPPFWRRGITGHA